MHASEGAEQLHGTSERVQRAMDQVAAAEAALGRARRELSAAQRAEYGWTDGLAGRRRVAEALTALEPLGWTFLDAVHWPGRPGVVIDHVGVGPGGVVVMFSRQWTGAVEVRGGVLRQNGIPRLREASAVSAAAGAVCALLDPAARATVTAFVCAVQHDVRPATVAPGVNVVGVREVGSAVAALAPRLSAVAVSDALDRLQACLVGPATPDQLTTRALTVYEGGPALPWPAPPDGLFDPASPAEPPGQVPGGAPAVSTPAVHVPIVPAVPAASPAVPVPAVPEPAAHEPARHEPAVRVPARHGPPDSVPAVHVPAVHAPAGAGRHRAPSRHATRGSAPMARRAVRTTVRRRWLACAGTAGCGLLGVSGWAVTSWLG